ncbi:MAG: hypothetical protein ACM65L_14780 [Microcoleus sp.]
MSVIVNLGLGRKSSEVDRAASILSYQAIVVVNCSQLNDRDRVTFNLAIHRKDTGSGTDLYRA